MLYPHFFFSLFLSFPFFFFFKLYFIYIWVWLLELIRYSESVFFLPVRGQQLVVENLSLLYIPGYARLLCRPLSEIREGASKSGEMAKRDERIPKERERHGSIRRARCVLKTRKWSQLCCVNFFVDQKARNHGRFTPCWPTHILVYTNTDGA